MNTASTPSDITLTAMIDIVAKEKGIDRAILIETVRQAVLKAAQSTFGEGLELETKFNDDTGEVDLHMFLTVISDEDAEDVAIGEVTLAEVRECGLEAEVGEELGFQIFYLPKDIEKAREQDRQYGKLLKIEVQRAQFGRIAAQSAKQVLIQRLRDAERDLIFNEYKDRKGELIRGIVRRFERGNIVVDLGRAEAILPQKEQTPRENYRAGERIVALLKEIDRRGQGPQIILSRSDAKLVEKLFEAEVPEIAEQIVSIKATAREAGARTKIAVASRDADVDPVGACVGMKGARVQAVVHELHQVEKIDIVHWDRDPTRFVCAAIAPAEVQKVILDEAEGRMELVVPDDKLSLAIGRKGQNVRLASQLTGWKLDIISESKFHEMEDRAIEALQRVPVIDEELARSMYRLGFRTVEEVADASVEEIATLPNVNLERAESVRSTAETIVVEERRGRILAARAGEEPLTSRDRMMLIRGMAEKLCQPFEAAGFDSPEAISNEAADRFALKTGIGIKKARALKQAAQSYLELEAQVLNDNEVLE